MVRTQRLVARRLGIARWLAVVGGSMGGMQALEWGVMHPERVRALVPIATASEASPWQIGYSLMGRRSVTLDPAFRGGDYYDAAPGDGPAAGLAAARIVAQITYRADLEYEERFGRESMDRIDHFSLDHRFEVERYLEYHGDKLVRRFDANSYLVLNKAMDLHDLGRRRGGIGRGPSVASTCRPSTCRSAPTPCIHPTSSSGSHDMLIADGVDSRYLMIDSPHGHDGFLLEAEALTEPIADFLDEVAKSDA